jgi:hypothetical protein
MTTRRRPRGRAPRGHLERRFRIGSLLVVWFRPPDKRLKSGALTGYSSRLSSAGPAPARAGASIPKAARAIVGVDESVTVAAGTFTCLHVHRVEATSGYSVVRCNKIAALSSNTRNVNDSVR